MLPIPREDGIACDNCPFWGGEKDSVEVIGRYGHWRMEPAHIVISSCRRHAPTITTGEIPMIEPTALCGVALIGGHRWTPAKHWCGEHPRICSAPAPRATTIELGQPSLEPDTTPLRKGD